ncbi:MAG TPA: anti-sigma factor, partial [Polyangia bacterium]|nr:anti-sigma factor [Polyangia bacterium]
MNEPSRHFSDDLLRGFAVGTASEGARLAIACHMDFCAACRAETATHEDALDALLAGPAPAVPSDLRARLMTAVESLPSPTPAPAVTATLPADLPPLPPALR